MNPRLSIVIPVYNSRKYLPACLDSIFCQEFRDYEVICVDDGSTDGSREVLEEYAKKDSRLRILFQVHGGPGTARNRGMAEARGDYLYFMDSDDCLEGRDGLSFLVEEMDSGKLDLLCFDACLSFESEELKERRYREMQYLASRREYGSFSAGAELFCVLVAEGRFIPSVWLHVLRRSFLEKDHLSFPATDRWEDMVFFFQAILLAGKVRHVGRTPYRRRVREGSLMTEPESFRYVEDAVYAFQKMTDFFMERKWMPDTEEAVLCHLGRQVQEIEKRCCALPREEQEKMASLPTKLRSYAHLMLLMAPIFRRAMASYIFPYHLFPKGTRVVIYGAGNVGREFYAQAAQGGYLQCVGIVDKRAGILRIPGLPVQPPEALPAMEWDWVLIAIEDRDLAEGARRDLLGMGILKDQIAWDGSRYLKKKFYQAYYFPLLDELHREREDGKGAS